MIDYIVYMKVENLTIKRNKKRKAMIWNNKYFNKCLVKFFSCL